MLLLLLFPISVAENGKEKPSRGAWRATRVKSALIIREQIFLNYLKRKTFFFVYINENCVEYAIAYAVVESSKNQRMSARLDRRIDCARLMFESVRHCNYDLIQNVSSGWCSVSCDNLKTFL